MLENLQSFDMIGIGLMTFAIGYFAYSLYINIPSKNDFPSAPIDKLTAEQLKIFYLKKVYEERYGYFPSETEFQEWHINERAKKMRLRSAIDTEESKENIETTVNTVQQDETLATRDLPDIVINEESKISQSSQPAINQVSPVNEQRLFTITEEEMDELLYENDVVKITVDYNQIIQYYIDKTNKDIELSLIPKYIFKNLFDNKFGLELDYSTDGVFSRVIRYANPSLWWLQITGESRLPLIVETLREIFSDEEIVEFLKSIEWLN